MEPYAIHITGASGSGVTTLGRALAARTGAVPLDTDDFYWAPVEPRFSAKREIAERLRLLCGAFDAAGPNGWILSGAIGDWGDPIVPLFKLVAFLRTPTEVRLQRLREREVRDFGDAIKPGGARHREFEDFIAWAAEYDSGTREGRSLPRHEAWLATLSCRVLQLDGTEAPEVNVGRVIKALR
ncbi:MAG: AAA family ATPase [Proteobacteria bacterium]|nr:AAA family ATPase [Pseudomonadota bacterium]